MSTTQKQSSRESVSRAKQRGRRTKLWLLWIPVAFMAFLITRLDVKSESPPAELFRAAETQTAAPVQTDEQVTGIADAAADEQGADENKSPAAESDAALGINSRGNTARVERYADISLSESEVYELACVVFLEANTQSLRGQQAVAEVLFNRVIADNFPDSVHDVIYEGIEGTSTLQLSTAPFIGEVTPNENQYLAIEQALYGPSILPDNVVFFSIEGENEHVWGSIDDHVFCYQYPWAED